MTHINAIHFANPRTGQLTFRCIRNDFDPTTLKVFDVSNCQDMEFTRVDWSGVISTMSAKFTNAEDKYNESEISTSTIRSLINQQLISKGYKKCQNN